MSLHPLAKLSRILAVYSKIEVSDDEFTPLSEGARSWRRPSVNSFEFQPCDHTPPGTQRL